MTLFENTHTRDTAIYCIFLINNFRLTFTCSLTFIPVSYAYTKISYIIEINSTSKQFCRLENEKIRNGKIRMENQLQDY